MFQLEIHHFQNSSSFASDVCMQGTSPTVTSNSMVSFMDHAFSSSCSHVGRLAASLECRWATRTYFMLACRLNNVSTLPRPPPSVSSRRRSSPHSCCDPHFLGERRGGCWPPPFGLAARGGCSVAALGLGRRTSLHGSADLLASCPRRRERSLLCCPALWRGRRAALGAWRRGAWRGGAWRGGGRP